MNKSQNWKKRQIRKIERCQKMSRDERLLKINKRLAKQKIHRLFKEFENQIKQIIEDL